MRIRYSPRLAGGNIPNRKNRAHPHSGPAPQTRISHTKTTRAGGRGQTRAKGRRTRGNGRQQACKGGQTSCKRTKNPQKPPPFPKNPCSRRAHFIFHPKIAPNSCIFIHHKPHLHQSRSADIPAVVQSKPQIIPATFLTACSAGCSGSKARGGPDRRFRPR
jgi:hypothetical protein